MAMVMRQYQWLSVLLVASIAHAVWVWAAIRAEHGGLTQQVDAVQFSVGGRNLGKDHSAADAFSVLFGVQPVLAENQAGEQTETIDPKYLRLTDAKPKLLAVDEIHGILTGRLWLSENLPAESGRAAKLRAVVLGDTLFHYQVTAVSLSSIELVFAPTTDHSWPADTLQELTLHLFKPIEAETSSTDGSE